MKYPKLEEPCKSATREGICLGCQALESPYFRGRKDCKYGKIPTAEESIKRGKEILRIGEQMKL